MAEADTERFAARLASLVDALDRQPTFFCPTEGVDSVADQEAEDSAEDSAEELEPAFAPVDGDAFAPATDSDTEEEHEAKLPGKATAETTGFLTELLLQGRKQLAAPSRQESDEHKVPVTLNEASLDTMD